MRDSNLFDYVLLAVLFIGIPLAWRSFAINRAGVADNAAKIVEAKVKGLSYLSDIYLADILVQDPITIEGNYDWSPVVGETLFSDERTEIGGVYGIGKKVCGQRKAFVPDGPHSPMPDYYVSCSTVIKVEIRCAEGSSLIMCPHHSNRLAMGRVLEYDTKTHSIMGPVLSFSKVEAEK